MSTVAIALTWTVGHHVSLDNIPERRVPATVPGAVQLDWAQAEGWPPYAVFIEFAINDAFVKYDTSPAEAQRNLETMIGRILKAQRPCQIILMKMDRPIGVHLESRPKIVEYYEVYRQVAKERKLLLIDHEPNWQKMLQQEKDTFAKYVPDGIHPNALGCENVILPQLLQSLNLSE